MPFLGGGSSSGGDGDGAALARANAAYSLANNAKTTADNAKTSSDTASANASAAVAKANQTKQDLDDLIAAGVGSQDDIDRAQSVADAAQIDATKALTDAFNAASVASQAATAAQTAQESAENAYSYAVAAQTTADGARSAADSAATIANGAAQDVVSAKTRADSAYNLGQSAAGAAANADSKATFAGTAAASAQTDATKALGDAATAKARADTAFTNAGSAANAATLAQNTADGAAANAVSAGVAAGNADSKAVAARNRADEAFAAAGVADGKAVTADGKAVTAQAKADQVALDLSNTTSALNATVADVTGLKNAQTQLATDVTAAAQSASAANQAAVAAQTTANKAYVVPTGGIPASALTQALQDQISAGTGSPGTPSGVSSVNGRTNAVTLTKTDVGLPNADNTSDINKPISTAQKVVSARSNSLSLLGQTLARHSQSASQAKFFDASEYTEKWASLASWNTGGVVFPVASDRLYGASDAVIVRPTPTGDVLARTSLKTVAGGAERFMWFGWSKSPAGTRGSASDFVGVGVHYGQAGGAANKIIVWNAGSETLVSDFTPGDTFYITAGQDSSQYWVTMTKADGVTGVASVRGSKSSFLPSQVGFYSNDVRGVTGDYFGRTTIRSGLVSSFDRLNEVSSPSLNTMVGSDGQPMTVLLPKNYDSRIPSPLVMYFHGFGGTELTPVDPATQLPSVVSALLANGYIVASSNAQGGSEVGTGWQSYKTLYQYCIDHFAVSSVVLFAESFGGVSALRVLADVDIPNIAALVAVYPVFDLANVYASNSVLASAIDTAYGSLAAAQAAGADPNLIDVSKFRGIPARVYASASDTSVSKSANADVLVSKFGVAAPSSAVVETTGNHGDSSNFQPADVIAYLTKILGTWNTYTSSSAPAAFTKTLVGLSNVDDTADLDKPVSTATATAIGLKFTKPVNGITTADLAQSVIDSLNKANSALQSAPVTSVANRTGAVTLTKSDVGLANVANIAPADLPISTATQAALNAKTSVYQLTSGTPNVPAGSPAGMYFFQS